MTALPDRSSPDTSPAKTPAVSVVSVVLNAAGCLERCLESVEAQSFAALEHLVIDGGSSDGTIGLLQRRRWPGLRWWSEPDRGIADAMNKGLARSRGEWVLFLHADDYLLHRQALALAYAHLQAGTGIALFQVRIPAILGPDRRVLRQPLLSRSKAWNWYTPFKVRICHQGVLMRRDLLLSLGGFEPSFKVSMDFDLFLRAFWQRVPVQSVPLTLAAMGPTGISSARDWGSISQRLAEERRAHLRNAPSLPWRLLYHLYWALYPRYRVASFTAVRLFGLSSRGP